MDKNRTEGIGKRIKGSVKEAAGRVTGDRSLETKGKGEKIVGKVQEGYGRVKDEIRASKQQSREQKQGRA